MRKTLVLATVLAAFAAALWQPRAPETFAAYEQARLRTHFDSAERGLRARDAHRLTVTQQAARARLLAILHRYWVRGIFPRNTDFPGRYMPTFIDYWGKRCGVAFLMEQTGNEEMVLRIAATENNARVPELRNDAEVRRWLDANGITLAEATRIQPAYGCGTIHGGPCPPVSTGYKVATGFIVGSNVTAFTLDALPAGRSSRARGIVAVGTGTVGILVGLPYVGESGQRQTLGLLNAGVGAASLALGIVRLTKNGQTETRSRVRLAPWFGPRAGTGFAAQVAF
ncbi:MAG TPA: hypothetical protein VGV12_06660 [Gemmatimonadales bacterium]|nr:hypothetical protein [Gemmatimonadales bacterium]